MAGTGFQPGPHETLAPMSHGLQGFDQEYEEWREGVMPYSGIIDRLPGLLPRGPGLTIAPESIRVMPKRDMNRASARNVTGALNAEGNQRSSWKEQGEER
jgi:hypothetical protein